MLFTEPFFLFLFLPSLLALYYAAPARIRGPLLLAASLLFYALGEGQYVLLLLASVLINYLAGRGVGGAWGAKRRRLALAAGIAANLALLCVFKYAGFLVQNLNRLVVALGLAPVPVPATRLPAGLSFFTFMGVSYLIDVYRRETAAERRPGIFALYLTLFPHLIAGPIVRYGQIVGELAGRRATRREFAEGVERFVVGLGKKMLIANTLGVTADAVFNLPAADLSAPAAWLGAIAFTLQIYFDFSGYTDMAVGLALMFGFHFPENFNYPYAAASITDFWRRWHITLSSWFRDYLFLPLSVRRPRRRIYLNVLLVFFLCGLWHGPRWNFVVWGLLHGSFIVAEQMGLSRWLARAGLLRHLYVMLVVVAGWVVFRAETLPHAWSFLKAMALIAPEGAFGYKLGPWLNGELVLALILGAAGSFPLVPLVRGWQERLASGLKGAGALAFDAAARLAALVCLAAIFLSSVALAAAGTYRPFIYFRF